MLSVRLMYLSKVYMTLMGTSTRCTGISLDSYEKGRVNLGYREGLLRDSILGRRLSERP